MKFLKKYLIPLEFLALVLLGFCYCNHDYGFSNVELSGREISAKIRLPYINVGPKAYRYNFTGSFDFPSKTSPIFQITADDCLLQLSINDQAVNLEDKFSGSVCDYNNGIGIDLSSYLIVGKNIFQAKISNKNGGAYGLKIQYKYSNIAYYLSFAFIAVLLLLLSQILSYLKFSKISVGIIIAGILIKLIYLSYTPAHIRAHDVMASTGHFDYIKVIAEEARLPAPHSGWEYHQPPVYYLLGALVYKTFIFAGKTKAGLALQFLALFFDLLFIIFSALIFKRVFKEQKVYYFLLTLISFWPAGVIHSVRLGNDTAFYGLYAAAFYFLLKGYPKLKSKQMANFLIGSFLAALAFSTKANALVIIALAVYLLLLSAWQNKSLRLWLLKPALISCLFFLLSLAVNLGDNFYFYLKGESADWLVGDVTSSLTNKLMVGREFFNFVYIDINKFSSEAFANPWSDSSGRQFFWNYLLKTFIFGEFSFKGSFFEFLSSLTSSVFVVYGILWLIALSSLRKKDLIQYHPFLFQLICFFGLLIAYRVKIPAASNNDFRYIFPVLISMAVLQGAGIEALKARGQIWIVRLSYIIGFVFVIMSASFFVLLRLFSY